MARIDNIANDPSVEAEDKLLGTDQNGRTKNFEVGTLYPYYRDRVFGESVVILPNLPTHADNAAAVAAGLAVNTVYKTATGELRIVHA